MSVPRQIDVFDVGGVLLARPFQVRRLGHFGWYVNDLDESRDFYTSTLGMSVTDVVSVTDMLPPFLQDMARSITDPRMIFTGFGSDHHSLLLAHKSFAVLDGPGRSPELTASQISWQVGSLDEVMDGFHYLEDRGVKVVRVGRDMPGSNWHVYFLDPDGFTIELYYGMEQIGWDRRSKPTSMYHYGGMGEPERPHLSEWGEILDASARGDDLMAGFRPSVDAEAKYDVGGVLLPRPFRVTKIGPVGLFVSDLDASVAYYRDLLGLRVSEETEIEGYRCVFLRHGADHHSIALYPLALREKLGFSSHSMVSSLGFELGSYRQLLSAIEFLGGQGWHRTDVVAAFHPGIDYAAHFLDPDGHCVQLYFYMEQIGWDGMTRSPHERRTIHSPWPETIEPLSDTYVDQTFQGPLG